VWRKKQGKAIERKTLGSGLNAGNIGAEIDVIQPALPAQTHALIAIHFAFGVSGKWPNGMEPSLRRS
jgi:hypothetical protein